jgi:signal transduction histidine kinase
MWKRFSLRARIFFLLAALILTTLGGGTVTLWHTRAMDSLFTALIDKNMASFQAAEELETSLLMQRGFATYYYLDGNPEWLQQLDRYHQTFLDWLQKARKSAYTEPMAEIINQIEVHYQNYRGARSRVIELYREGKREEGAKLHWQVRSQFAALFDLCERYKLMHEYAIDRARTESQARARFITTFAMIVMPGVAVLGMLLAYILLKQILEPIRVLALEAGPAPSDPFLPDEVRALSRRVHNLMENVDQTQSELERSQEHLAQAEKWALVGKLAAGAAHSIRNPLTSVKMRLWSMNRSLDLNVPQREDLEAISEEIRHIDTIVTNFLQFSRPQKLKQEMISPSEVVDQALKLMHNRLQLYAVEVKLERQTRLPEIMADPEQLREAMVNLMVNACEAMVGGGSLTIREEKGETKDLGRVAILRVTDTGPGIPAAIKDQVMQPFFSTKEEGTGLGLSIANRIVKDHGGTLDLDSQEGRGTTFIITLPFPKDQAWAIS